MGRIISLIFDSFKGSIGAAEIGGIVREKLSPFLPTIELVNFPASDGGDGFVEALAYHTGGERVECEVADPLGRRRTARYIWSGAGRTAIIESAEANGLTLLADDERDPLKTTTRGVGELLLDAASRGAERIIVGVGGSATVDGGVGMAEALGFEFSDAYGITPPGACPLGDIEILVACDVRTELLGPRHSSAVWIYGPQKGGTGQSLCAIEKSLSRVDKLVWAMVGLEYGRLEMGGAAGGLAAGLAVFAGAELRRGVSLFDELAGLTRQIDESALVITGEGRLDEQSAEGKVVSYVSRAARRAGVPVIALCGAARTHGLPLDGLLCLTDSGMDSEQCITRPGQAVEMIAPHLAELIREHLPGGRVSS